VQFIDAAALDCRAIATRVGLAAHEIPVAFHVDIEPWTVSGMRDLCCCVVDVCFRFRTR
jgi:hypothetical protein